MFKLTNLKISYDDFNVINNVNGNFIVENEINIIFGQNGVGKTSFIEALNLVSDNYKGEISYLGHNYSELDSKQKLDLLNSEFAYIPQKFNLIDDLNAIENLELVANKKYEKNYYIDILDKLNISSSFYNEKVKKLSLGMKQRVAIARALVNNPRVIFFDEPTASLDFKNIDNFISIIEELRAKGVTVVIITHDNIFFEKYKYIIEVENTKVIPTYIINNDNSEVEFIKQRKKNINLINKSSKVFKYLFFSLILMATLIVSTIVVAEEYYLYNELYVDSLNQTPENGIVLSYQPFKEEAGGVRYYTPEDIEAIENIEGVNAVYPYSNPSNTNLIEYVYYNFGYIGAEYKTDMLMLPEKQFEEYNYLGITLVAGSYPEDDSNEILLPSSKVDYLITSGYINSYEDIIGLEAEASKEGYFGETKVEVSGIYNSDLNDLELSDPVYFGYNNELIQYFVDLELAMNNENHSADFSGTYSYIYVDLERGANKDAVEDAILMQSDYLYPESNYNENIIGLFMAIIVSLLIYSVALIIIFALITLKNRQNNAILKSLGYQRSVISRNTIKQNNKYVIISLIITSICYLVTTLILGITYLPILVVTLVVIFITALICNLITSIFIK